jgi:hypothetical protein
MTIERLTVLTCDACDEEHIPGANASEVRKRARADNWRLNDQGEDYCPGCRRDYESPEIDDEDSEDPDANR